MNHLGDVKFEIMETHILRKNDWSLEEFFDWLLGGHIHFIIGHLHQGTESFQWTVKDIYDQAQRLRYHPGKPCGDQLDCPIFTQDKFKYLEVLQDNVMTSHKIDISDDLDMVGVETLIKR